MTYEEITEIREYLGISQARMARAMMIHKNSWNEWKHGRNGISGAVSQLARLMRDDPEILDRLEDKVERMELCQDSKK